MYLAQHQAVARLGGPRHVRRRRQLRRVRVLLRPLLSTDPYVNSRSRDPYVNSRSTDPYVNSRSSDP